MRLAQEKIAQRRIQRKRVLVAMWVGVFWQDVQDGIQSWVSDNGGKWHLHLAAGPRRYAKTLKWMAGEGRVDGVISLYHGEDELETLRSAGIPIVVIDADQTFDLDAARGRRCRVASVVMDMDELGRVAVDHFLDRATFRCGGYVENYVGNDWSRRRGDACLSEFERRGLPTHRFTHHGKSCAPGSDKTPDFDGLADWLRALEKPAAVIAANDATANDIVTLCAAMDIAVPREISVLGMDDNPVICRQCIPNISSIHFDGFRAGRLAAEALAALIAGRKPPAPDALRYGVARVARRGSSASTPSAGTLVQRALDYIDAHACEGATLADVVRHCSYSRSLVMKRFREMTGRSVEKAIIARKLEEARRLLRETPLPAEEIAPLCGYETASALRRAFKRELGTTLSTWRESL